MSELDAFHANYGAVHTERGGRSVIDHYGRPEREHLAVRNGVGIIEQPYDVVIVAGEDRIEYVDNVVTNAVPKTAGTGCFAFILGPKGRVELDLYLYVASDRLLLFLPVGTAPALVSDWREKVFIQDVTIQDATAEYVVIGVHGPLATEKLASVMGGPVPEERFAYTQASLEQAGITVIPTDAPTGEESYEVVCARYDAEVVMDTLVNRGMNAAPFGIRAWETLTLEAGSLTSADMVGELPNVLGLRTGLDFEKGCFVGQEVVSRIENLGQLSKRVVGLRVPDTPSDGAQLLVDDEAVGAVIRAGEVPGHEESLGLGLVKTGVEAHEVDVELNGSTTTAAVVSLPFVAGSDSSGRCPNYEAIN